MRYLIALLTTLAVAPLIACSDSPIAPEPADTPTWCSPLAFLLIGDYQRHYHQRMEQFAVFLSIEAQRADDCLLSWSVEHRLLGDSPKTMLRTSGDLLVTETTATGDVIVYGFEALLRHSEQMGHDGEMVVDDTPRISQTHQAKLWGDALLIWGNQYVREEY